MKGIQVSKEHYYKDYDNLARFISYFYQVDLVKQLKKKNILEVGIGNKTIANYLKQNGFKVTTCDFDKRLEPDKVGDIRSLPFRDKSFDVVLAYEILEHMPFKDVDTTLRELHRVTKKYVVISVPYSSLYFEIICNSPLINKIFKKLYVNLHLHVPYFFLKPQESKHHYWEMGREGYSVRKIRKMLRKRFKIIKEIKPLLSVSHHFFVLERD